MALQIINQKQFDKVYKDHLSWLDGTGNKGKKGDFSYCDLTKISFKKISTLDCFVFHGSILKDVIFSNISMCDVDFSEANLNGCLFENVKAKSCVFEKSTLKNVEIRNSDFSRSNFSDTNITYIYLYNTLLNNVSFSNSNLFLSLIIKCEISGTIFDQDKISSIRFNSTSISKKYRKFLASENLVIDNTILTKQVDKFEERIEKYKTENYIDEENSTATYGVDLIRKMNDLFEEIIFIKRQIQINNGEIIEFSLKKRIYNLLSSVRFWTIIGVLFSSICAAAIIRSCIEEKKWNFTVNFDGYTVKNKEFLSVTYLLPDDKINFDELNTLIPFRIKTKNKAVKNLKVEIRYYHSLYEEKQHNRALDVNSTNERTYMYMHNSELVTKSFPHITSHDAVYLNENFRIFPNIYKNLKNGDRGFPSKEEGYVDNFIIMYRITCDEATQSPLLFAVCVNVFKSDNIENWIKKTEELGHYFLMPSVMSN